MAEKKIGLVLALDKDKEFKDNLRACKDEVKLYKDSLKELTDGFKTNKATMEDLKKVQEDLKGKQEAYKKQLEAAKTGLEHANDQYDKQNKALQDLKEKLIAAEQAQDKLNAEGKEGTEEYKKAAAEVDKLKDAVAKQAANCATAETNVNKWTREVKNAERGLESCEKELEDNARDMDNLADQTDDASKSMDKFADEMEDADKQSGKFSISIKDMVKNKLIDLAGDALRNLGQKALEAAKYVVEVGSAFEAQMSKVKAISGASEEEVEKLRAAAEEMGRTTKFTASEAGEALEYMAMAGWKTDDMLAGLSGVMDLAAASGTDLGTTSDIVTDALTAFGKSAEDSGRLADIMAAASSNANTNVEMMGETFKYAAPVAGALGYSMEDTAVAIGLMANAGIKASQAGTSIRTGLTRLVSPTKQAKEAMEAYGISVTDTDGNMLSFHDMMVQIREKLGGLDEAEQAAAASAIFGKQSMSGWLAVINASDADFDSLTQSIYDSDGAAKNMAETMQDNLQGKVTLFNSAMQGLANSLYKYFSGTLSDVVTFATEVINKITDALTPQKTELDKFIESVKGANKQAQDSLKTAQETMRNAGRKVSEMESAKTYLTDVLKNCQQFNETDLKQTSDKMTGELKDVATNGFGTVSSKAKSAKADAEDIGNAKIKTDTAAQNVEDYNALIGSIITQIDNIDTSVGNIGASASGTTESLGGVTEALGYMSQAEEGVVIVTDAFTKSKITSVVNQLKDDVPELADAWDENTGALKLSVAEVQEYISNAQKIALTQAYIKAHTEAYNAMIEAELAAQMAESGLREATKATTEVQKDADEQISGGLIAQGVYSEALQETFENTSELEKEQEEANATLDKSRQLVDLVTQSAKDHGISLEEEASATDDAAGSTLEYESALDALEAQLDDTEKSTEDLAEEQLKAVEAIKAFQDEFGMTIEDLRMLQTELGKSDEEFAEWCQDQVDAFNTLKQEYGSFVEGVATSLSDYVNTLDATGEEGEKSLQNLISSYETHLQEVRTWGENMKTLAGMIGNGFSQKLYDQIAQEGFSKSKDTVQLLVESIDQETGQFNEEGQKAADLMLQGLTEPNLIAKGVTDMSTIGQQYAEAQKKGYTGSIEEYKKTVEEGTQSAADAGKAKAEETGAETGETLAEKEAEGAKSKSEVVAEASEAVIEAAQEAANTATDIFRAVGRLISTNMAAGIGEMRESPVKSMQKVLEGLQTELDKSERTAYEASKKMMTAFKNGIVQNDDEPLRAMQTLVDAINEEADNCASKLHDAGDMAAMELAAGLSSRSYDVASAAGHLAGVAQDAAASWNNAFYNTGYYMSAGLADGIYSGRSRAMDAAAAVARSALNTARNILGVRSPSKEFEMIGEMSDEGLAKGLRENLDKVTDASQNAAYEALKAAQATLNDGTFQTSMSMVNSISMDSMRTLESIGNVDAGVSDVGGIINAMRNDLLGRLADFQGAMTAQGAQRQHVILQVGSAQFDAYLVNTATNGLNAAHYNQMQGAGL